MKQNRAKQNLKKRSVKNVSNKNMTIKEYLQTFFTYNMALKSTKNFNCHTHIRTVKKYKYSK